MRRNFQLFWKLAAEECCGLFGRSRLVGGRLNDRGKKDHREMSKLNTHGVYNWPGRIRQAGQRPANSRLVAMGQLGGKNELFFTQS